MFVGHSAPDRMVTVADVWREPPVDEEIVMHDWNVPPQPVPRKSAERERRPYDWFETVDAWVDENRPE